MCQCTLLCCCQYYSTLGALISCLLITCFYSNTFFVLFWWGFFNVSQPLPISLDMPTWYWWELNVNQPSSFRRPCPFSWISLVGKSAGTVLIGSACYTTLMHCFHFWENTKWDYCLSLGSHKIQTVTPSIQERVSKMLPMCIMVSLTYS